MPSPAARALIDSFRKDLKESGIFTGSLEVARDVWDDYAETVPAYSPGVTLDEVAEGAVRGEWVDHPAASRHRVVLHFHGGGYVIGRPKTYRNFNARVSEGADARVFSVDYRLAPEDRFPAARDDCLAAYRWVLEQGRSAAEVAFVGESAGGGLVMATLLAARDAGLPLPACAVAISPWVDLTNSGESHGTNREPDAMIPPGLLGAWAKEYLGGADPKNPGASPLFGDPTGLPPIYLLVGSTEVLLDDARRLFTKLSSAGIETSIDVGPEMPHNWPLFAYAIPEGEASVRKIGAFFRQHLGAADTSGSAA